MNRKKIKRGPGKQWLTREDFVLADEVDYIQRQAAQHVGRVVAVGRLVLFSTETGDAWLLDPCDQLAARIASDGDPELISIEETDINFTIGWKGHYRIEGGAFIYTDRESGRVVTIHGYLPPRLPNQGRLEKSLISGQKNGASRMSNFFVLRKWFDQSA